ncbi:MAG: MBL fold metallo-hydrolase [Firmicutes bacterium]|nr:MBL fold metallo-hydrolase [Bacillota bacterium]
MQAIAPKTTLIDLKYLGYPEAIATCLLEGDGELALVDPGPTTCLDTLEGELAGRGLRLTDLTALLLTHIHLDHAGACGALVRRNPRLRVYVQERGAVHLTDPSRLLLSAARLYGDQMQRLWGEVAPVPAGNLQVLRGGETIALAGRKIAVAYTPGHATHHVSYFDASTGIAFVGDTCGLRYPGYTLVLPLTPPPDIDLEVWPRSWQQIRSWRPERLFPTHFGPAGDVEAHLAQLEERITRWAEYARQTLAQQGSDAERVGWFLQQVEAELYRELPAEAVRRHLVGTAPEQCWYGLARYWRKRAG